MAELKIDAAELLKLLQGKEDKNSLALVEQATEKLAEEKKLKERDKTEKAIWSKVNDWKSKYLSQVVVPDIVTAISITFNLDSETTPKKFVFDSIVHTEYTGREASGEMKRLVSELAKVSADDGDVGDLLSHVYDEIGLSESRRQQIIAQQSWVETGLAEIHEYISQLYSDDFSANMKIADDEGVISVTMDGFVDIDVDGESKHLPKWETDVSLGKRTSRSSNGSKVSIDGYKTVREYLETIADDDLKSKLKEHKNDWTKINASQHAIRIEKNLPVSKRLYHKAKGLI